MAISVEFGPGIRFVPPTRSRNSCSLTHPRRRTTSSRIMAICAAGPPKAMHPNFKNTPATSLSADADVDSVFGSLTGDCPPVGGDASSAIAALSSTDGVYPWRLYHSHGLSHWRPLAARPRLCHDRASLTRRQATPHEVSRPEFLSHRPRRYGRMALHCEPERDVRLQHRSFVMRGNPRGLHPLPSWACDSAGDARPHHENRIGAA